MSSLASRFDVANATAWQTHLDEKGYVVLKSIADHQEVETAKSLLWADLELMNPGLSRQDANTWDIGCNPPFGLCTELAQSQGIWSIRGLSKLKEVFATIWGTDDLLVSLDCVLLREAGMPSDDVGTEGLHIDQNPFKKRYRESVQGMMPLLHVTPAAGGLEVVPLTHLENFHTRVLEKQAPDLKEMPLDCDWCPLKGYPKLHRQLQKHARLLLAEPGDLILWDSRTIHGGRLPDEKAVDAAQTETGQVPDLARLSCAVTMTPRAFSIPSRIAAFREGATVSFEISGVIDESDRQVLVQRRLGVETGSIPFNHCPHLLHEFNDDDDDEDDDVASYAAEGSDYEYRRPALTAAMERLVDGGLNQ